MPSSFRAQQHRFNLVIRIVYSWHRFPVAPQGATVELVPPIRQRHRAILAFAAVTGVLLAAVVALYLFYDIPAQDDSDLTPPPRPPYPGGEPELFALLRAQDPNSVLPDHLTHSVVLALRITEIETGRLPATLSAILPGLLPHPPSDPYNGTPLRSDAARRLVW